MTILIPLSTPASKTTMSGVAWMLVSALAIAVYYIWSAELAEEFGTMAVAAWNALAGFIAVLPLAGWEMAHTPFEITAQALWMAASLGVAVTVPGLLLWLHLLRTVPACVAASVEYLQRALSAEDRGAARWSSAASV